MTGDVLAVDLTADRSNINAAIAHLCAELAAQLPPPLPDAISYTVRGPGKRLRGILVAAAYRAAGGEGDPFPLGAAVELLHAYSLAHDDLPCMDNDDMRRGRLSTHRVYGVDVTVVAGVAMLPATARAIARAAAPGGWTSDCTRAIVRELMAAAGASGMIGGQLADLEAEEAPARTTEGLARIHRAKTGALIAASARVGGIAAGATDACIAALGRYGADLGLAFQIVDDVLDVTSTTDQLGKIAGRDAQLRKSTYPGLMGVNGAMSHAQTLVREGCDALNDVGLLTPQLRHIADLIITRTH